jgi:hypothetical protein
MDSLLKYKGKLIPLPLTFDTRAPALPVESVVNAKSFGQRMFTSMFSMLALEP